MKNLAKLTLFFSLNFTILFAAAVLLGLLASWIEFARFIPLGTASAKNITDLAWNALPVALYLAILLTLSYTARRNMPIPLAISGTLLLACIVYMGLALGISRAGLMELNFRPASAVQGAPGLILSRSENVMILLRDSTDIWGPRVVSLPGQPLIYQDIPMGPNNTVLPLPPLPFGDTTPWFARSLAIDFSLSAAELRGRLEYGLIPFAVYAFSLVLLLASLRFVLGLTHWPLANLFLGALVFRGIVSLEGFLNSREINTMIDSFLPGQVPPLFITPVIFGALALLVIFYTLLARIVRPRRDEDAW